MFLTMCWQSSFANDFYEGLFAARAYDVQLTAATHHTTPEQIVVDSIVMRRVVPSTARSSDPGAQRGDQIFATCPLGGSWRFETDRTRSAFGRSELQRQRNPGTRDHLLLRHHNREPRVAPGNVLGPGSDCARAILILAMAGLSSDLNHIYNGKAESARLIAPSLLPSMSRLLNFCDVAR